jgi:hypothetical protein
MGEVHASICELTLQAEPPTYNAVLEVNTYYGYNNHLT